MKRKSYPRFDKLNSSSVSASYCKTHTPSTDTTPERLLRTSLHRAGLRFRKNALTVMGKPDIIFVSARVAIFIDGDFWHGKNWRKRRLRLANGSNRAYWLAKIEANMRRDRQVLRTLTKDGWIVLRFWESDVKTSLETISQQVSAVVRNSTSQNNSAARMFEGRR